MPRLLERREEGLGSWAPGSEGEGSWGSGPLGQREEGDGGLDLRSELEGAGGGILKGFFFWKEKFGASVFVGGGGCQKPKWETRPSSGSQLLRAGRPALWRPPARSRFREGRFGRRCDLVSSAPGGDGTGPSRAQEPCCNRADEDRPRQDLLRAYGELQRSGRVPSLPSIAHPMPIFYPTKPAEGRQDSARLMQKLSLRSGGTEPFSQLLSPRSVPAKMNTLDTPRKGRDGGSGQRLTHCLSSTWGKGPSSKAGSQTKDVGP